MEAKTNSYSVSYSISIINGKTEHCVEQVVAGYPSIEVAKDDIESQIRVLMHKNGIKKATLTIDTIISDPNNEWCDSDSSHAEYDDGVITFNY